MGIDPKGAITFMLSFCGKEDTSEKELELQKNKRSIFQAFFSRHANKCFDIFYDSKIDGKRI